ncbi:MAG: phage tail sheath subtilisin-like domain-containing protein [Candidatus Neomarinimicrobiota bacterium]
MPVTPTYPGVYIEELPSGVRTITGVATSITAFVGRALRGPLNDPKTINNYGDYERIFGGLWIKSAMSYAVRDFFGNGGGQAIIVRLYHPLYSATEETNAGNAAQEVADEAKDKSEEERGPDDEAVSPAEVAAAARTKADAYVLAEKKEAGNIVATAAEKAAAIDTNDVAAVVAAAAAAVDSATPTITAELVLGNTDSALTLMAASPGSWGNGLRVRVDYDVSADTADGMGVSETDLFNLAINDSSTGGTEHFRNLTVIDSSRRIDKVLENESNLLRADEDTLPGEPPDEHPAPLAGETKWDSGSQANSQLGVLEAATDGKHLDENDFTGTGMAGGKEGLYALEHADLFNLLCIPPHKVDNSIESTLIGQAATYCEKRRAIFLVDPPHGWKTKDNARDNKDTIGTNSKNSALFFPRLTKSNPLKDGQMEEFVPCGSIAGVIARTDVQRGFWKAPAGLNATLVGVPKLSVPLTDEENGELNPLGINCLRAMGPAGRVVWGARTLQGDDRLASEWKYLSVRRVALYIEESLYRGSQWVVFEPNDEPLWAQIRLNMGAFMHNLFRMGAFQGSSPKDAYFVKCSKETTTQNDINLGIVNILIGFAPLKPAEFVIIKIQQMAGQVEA